MTTNDEKAVEFITSYLNKVRDRLDEWAIEGAEHYVRYGEYQMAFELLILGVMRADAVIPEFKEARSIGLGLRLDKEETIFDHEFWNRFTLFYNNIYPTCDD